MNEHYPHEILPESEVRKLPPEVQKHFRRITQQAARRLITKTPEERALWLLHHPIDAEAVRKAEAKRERKSMTKYTEWIRKNVPTDLVLVRGTCAEVTTAMAKAFPELTRVRGHYMCPMWGKRDHWWMKTKAGNVLDPTVGQFPTRGVGAEYVEWVEGTEEPTGMCPNCGGECYKGRAVCSDKCHAEYAAYLMHGNP